MFSQIKQLHFKWYIKISIIFLFILGLPHRFRGTWGWFSAVNAIAISMIVFLTMPVSDIIFQISLFLSSVGIHSNTHLVLLVISLLTGAIYMLGESYGYGAWVGGLVEEDRQYAYITNRYQKEGGKYTGIQWLATMICPPTSFDKWLEHCRIALFIRSFYWWFPFYSMFLFFDVDFDKIITASLILSFAFPLACDLGRYTARKWNFKFMTGGWEHGEVIFGAVQIIVFTSLILFK